MGQEKAINLSKEILSNLEKIPFLYRIININDIYNYLGLERKISTQEIKPIKSDEYDQKEKVKEIIFSFNYVKISCFNHNN